MPGLKKTMFREYDIRGRVNDEELNARSAEWIGRGFGTFLARRGIDDMVVGYDSRFGSVEIKDGLVKGLRADAGLRERVERLQSIRSVGEILALTWALEIGEVKRFSSIADAVSSPVSLNPSPRRVTSARSTTVRHDPAASFSPMWSFTELVPTSMTA